MSSLVIESWIWYGVSWVVVIARLISRWMVRGTLRKLQVDDYIIIFVMAADTVLVAGLNIVATTSSNLIDPAHPIPLTPENIETMTYGSKMVLVVEQMQITVTWLVKGCLLLMYYRLTHDLTRDWIVKAVSCYVALGWLIMEILYLGVWCRPIYEYWAVPSDNVQCTAATNHLITNAVFNISSDLMIISIPMPMLIRSLLPVRKKLILAAVFALGAFTILCAVLNKYYSFTDPFGQDWTFWYLRESSTAIIVANLPFAWALFRRAFNFSSFSEHSRATASTAVVKRFRSGYANHESVIETRVREGDEESAEGLEDSGRESSDEIMKGSPMSVPLEIYKRKEVSVTEERVESAFRGSPRGSSLSPAIVPQSLYPTVAETLAEHGVWSGDARSSMDVSTDHIISERRAL